MKTLLVILSTANALKSDSCIKSRLLGMGEGVDDYTINTVIKELLLYDTFIPIASVIALCSLFTMFMSIAVFPYTRKLEVGQETSYKENVNFFTFSLLHIASYIPLAGLYYVDDYFKFIMASRMSSFLLIAIVLHAYMTLMFVLKHFPASKAKLESIYKRSSAKNNINDESITYVVDGILFIAFLTFTFIVPGFEITLFFYDSAFHLGFLSFSLARLTFFYTALLKKNVKGQEMSFEEFKASSLIENSTVSNEPVGPSPVANIEIEASLPVQDDSASKSGSSQTPNIEPVASNNTPNHQQSTI